MRKGATVVRVSQAASNSVRRCRESIGQCIAVRTAHPVKPIHLQVAGVEAAVNPGGRFVALVERALPDGAASTIGSTKPIRKGIKS